MIHAKLSFRYALVALFLFSFFNFRAVSAEEIKRRADAPQPMSVDQSLQHFHLPADLRIEIAASEPLLSDPSSIAWDEAGRMFIGEIHGYNLEGHLDVQELNKTGQLDRVVRRIPASQQAQEAAEKETYGTVKMLVDTDGDGRMDEAKLWADRLPPCFGIVPARGGIIAVGRPDLIFLADHDNDGRAEIRETLFTGFEMTILERSINNPRWGLDNWIYVSAGRAGGHITGPRLTSPVDLSATDFRFKPDGTAIEPVTGRNYMYGQTMTDWGDRFVTPPGLYAIPIPWHYLTRNPYLPSPSVNADAAGYNRLYPASQPHPWRVERSQEKEWSDYYSNRYGASESAPNGFFTSACGQMIYRANALPAHYRDNHFCCDPAQNLIHRSLLERDGLRFRARRAPEEQHSEFLTSTDQWFRPLNLETGPDGAIYVVDMYREIIEDYSAIPRYLQQQYGLIEGQNRGRVWRVLPKEAMTQPAQKLVGLPLKQLVSQLAGPNAWTRSTAQRLLVERGSSKAIPALTDLLIRGETPQARLHALYTLEGLQALEPLSLEHALRDPHYAVRLHAMRLCEPELVQNPNLLDNVLGCLTDPDAKVRLQLALTLGQIEGGRALPALAELASRDGADEWFQAAILSSAVDSADPLLSILIEQALQSDGAKSQSRSLLNPLSAMIGSRHRDQEIANLLSTVAADESKELADVQIDCLSGLAEGLQRGEPLELTAAEGKNALRRLLATGSAETRVLALRIARLTRFTESQEMQALLADAAQNSLDEQLPIEQRLAAIDILSSAAQHSFLAIARQLLDARQPVALQLSVVAGIASMDDPAVTAILLDNWPHLSPTAQQASLDAIFGRIERLAPLLDALAAGAISPQHLSTLQRAQLLNSPDTDLRARATSILADHMSQKNPELLERYRSALSQPRDAARGELVFQRICASCHRINHQDTLVGPDLSVVQTRSDEAVLLDILQPSARIAAGFPSYVVIDTSGRAYSGIMTTETATSVTLRSAPPAGTPGKEAAPTDHVILRKDIEEMMASDQSLMPDNLEKELTPQDVAELMAYLRQKLGPQQSPLQTLFDEDSAFVVALTQGQGTATLETADAFSGNTSLRLSPPQRYSPQIPGWEFSIREHPEPGEFRFLRFAWKTVDAEGVMIELADRQRWPDANRPVRRYYAGKNTTAWQATQVSDQTPSEWTVVIRDLWRDVGEFTLTGIAPTAMGGQVLFDRIELIRSLDDVE